MMLANALRLLDAACLERVTLVRKPERVAAEEENLGGRYNDLMRLCSRIAG
jgi:hypothetical protein